MKFAANLSMLYGHLPLEDRFSAAAADGFSAAEILFPYDESPEWYARQLEQNGLQLVLMNTLVDPARYPMGMAAQLDASASFRDAFKRSLDLCEASGCQAVHVMTGPLDPAAQPTEQQARLVDNLRWAASRNRSVQLHLEPLNRIDVPDYFYHCPEQAVAILQDVDEPNVGLQFDFYHVVKQGLDLPGELEKHQSWVRHVQVAGSPERHEPDLERDQLLTGFSQLNQMGYTGYVGFEYRPRQQAGAGLDWARPLVDRGWVSNSGPRFA